MFVGVSTGIGRYFPRPSGGGGATVMQSVLQNYDGVHSFFMQTSGYSMPNTSGAITISSWLKTPDFGGAANATEQIMGLEAFSASSTKVFMTSSTVRLVANNFQGGAHNTSVALDNSVSQWRLVSITFDPGVAIKVYVDGVLMITGADSRSSISTLPAFGITTAKFYSGGAVILNKMYTFSDQTTDAQQLAMYNGGTPVDATDSGLLANTNLVSDFTFSADGGTGFKTNYQDWVSGAKYKVYSSQSTSPNASIGYMESTGNVVSEALTIDSPI